MHVKGKSCNSPEDLLLFFKVTSTWVFSCEQSKNIQLPWGHLSFLQNLLNFIIRKYLKQEVDDDLSICVNEWSPCGLYIAENIKTYQCHVIKRWWRYYPQWRSALWTSPKELLLLPKFDSSSPSHAYELMTHYHLRRSTQWNHLNEVYLQSKFAVDWRYSDFQTGHFADFKHFKVDIHFADVGQVTIDPTHSLFLTLDRSQLFYWVWAKQAAKNNPNQHW